MTTEEHRRDVLTKLGFQKKRGRRGKHEKWTLEDSKGRATLLTLVPHGKKEIPAGTLSRMRQQLYLESDEYRLVAACSMNKVQYSRLLADRYPSH